MHMVAYVSGFVLWLDFWAIQIQFIKRGDTQIVVPESQIEEFNHRETRPSDVGDGLSLLGEKSRDTERICNIERTPGTLRSRLKSRKIRRLALMSAGCVD